MRVTKLALSNFRNYKTCETTLVPGRNILVGENAQGKTNLLEAIELLSGIKSTRADHDADLIRWKEEYMHARLEFEARGSLQELRLAMGKPAGAARLEKQVTVNGVTYKSTGELLGRLLIVSFKSQDLNLLRGGPKVRRDWLDALILKLRPAFQETFANYKKSVSQRNRLLKQIAEKGKVTVTDQDQLLVWDKQLARFGARVIKERLSLLAQLLPIAEQHQSRISRAQESLSIRYIFKASELADDGVASDDDDAAASGETDGSEGEVSTAVLSAAQLAQMEEIEIAKTLMKLLKDRRYEEIRRKQTLLGPHRDDLVFYLNGADAISFASQGQQRSIVLSLKLAELALIRSTLDESPVLLLDDVLAELDEFRQGLLMSVVEDGMQAIITTTHVSGFDPRWLEGATVFRVHAGHLTEPGAAERTEPGAAERTESGAAERTESGAAERTEPGAAASRRHAATSVFD